LLVRLEWTPVHFRNLARLKSPPRLNASLPRWEPPSVREAEPVKRRSGGLVQIGNALSLAHADLVGWAQSLREDRPQLADELDALGSLDEPGFVTAFCGLLVDHVSTLLTLPWCGELLAGLTRMERRLGRLSDEWVPGWYAGKCECGTACYVEPGVTWVTCPGCGATTAASDHIDVILREAADWCARPKGTAGKPGIAEVVVALTRETSVTTVANRIRNWHKYGGLMACYAVDRDGDPIPNAKLYRLGDIIDRLKESA